MLKTTLRGYQSEAVRKALRYSGFALFPEQRTGKCLVSLAIADHVKPDIIFIVCPKKALRVWSSEFSKHLDLDWDCYVRYVHFEASAKEAVDRRRYYKLATKWQKQGRSIMVIVDEAHRCKKRGTRNSRFIRTLGKRASHRLALTGTPIAQGHKDAWPIYDFIQPGVFGKWEDFENRFLMIESKENRSTGAIYKRIVGVQNEEEFNEIFHKYSYRITLGEARKAEGLMPAKIRHRKIKFQLKKQSWIHYDELSLDLETMIRGRVVSTPLVLTLAMKLQQIAGGYLIQDERVPGQRKKKRTVHRIGEEKLAVLLRALRTPELAKKDHLVICCRFKHEIARISQLLTEEGVTSKIISGKHEYDGQFDVRVVILQIQGAEAIDLSLSNTYIFYSWNHSLINYEQARFRVQAFDTLQVNYWYLIAEDTVDEDMYLAVVKKKNLATLVCDRYRRKNERH